MFRTLQAQLEFDPTHPETSQISVSVALASVDVGSAEGNTEVQRPAWFNTAAFPLAKFTAQQVQALGADRYRVTGSLSLKGHTLPLTLIAQAQPLAGGISFTSTFSVQRLALGVGTGVWADTETVADTVKITLVLTFIPVV
jgi:polyisoprenoid-binding protein YceI